MKNLIRNILKESVDNRIVDILIKLKLTDYKKIVDLLIETGYDEEEINEVYSIYFKSVSGLELSPTNWMDFYFSPNQLEIFEDDNYPNTLFIKKNGKVVMEKDKIETSKYKVIFIDFIMIWDVFNTLFLMNDKEVSTFLKKWLEENFNIQNYTPHYQMLSTI